MKCICKHCGKEFDVKYPSKKRDYCSKTCAQLHRWENTPKNLLEYQCEICGINFFVSSSDHRVKDGKKIKYCSKKCMGEGQKKGVVKKCPICGKDFYTTRNTYCSPECAREYRKIIYKHKTYMENGYIIEYKNGYNKKGNVKQHRRIMEEHLGRSLEPTEVVHHINGIKTDNRIENLEVMDKGTHSAYHRKKEKADGKHLFGGYNNN